MAPTKIYHNSCGAPKTRDPLPSGMHLAIPFSQKVSEACKIHSAATR